MHHDPTYEFGESCSQIIAEVDIGECHVQLCEQTVDHRFPQLTLRREVIVDLRLVSFGTIRDRGRGRSVVSLLGKLGDRRLEEQLTDIVAIAPESGTVGSRKGRTGWGLSCHDTTVGGRGQRCSYEFILVLACSRFGREFLTGNVLKAQLVRIEATN